MSAPIDHYTGTLYKALAARDWSPEERSWAHAHLLVHDAEAGIVSAQRWDRVEFASLEGDLLVDARSGEYVRRVRPPADAVSLRVVREGEDGRRLAISHWNKHHKGVLAAALVRDRPEVASVDDLLAWARGAGVRLESTGERTLDLVVEP